MWSIKNKMQHVFHKYSISQLIQNIILPNMFRNSFSWYCKSVVKDVSFIRLEFWFHLQYRRLGFKIGPCPKNSSSFWWIEITNYLICKGIGITIHSRHFALEGGIWPLFIQYFLCQYFLKIMKSLKSSLRLLVINNNFETSLDCLVNYCSWTAWIFLDFQAKQKDHLFTAEICIQ